MHHIVGLVLHLTPCPCRNADPHSMHILGIHYKNRTKEPVIPVLVL